MKTSIDAGRAERRVDLLYPYKGDASYYSVPGGGSVRERVWTSEDPYAAVAAIKNHVACYPDRVDSIDEVPLAVSTRG